MAGASVLWFDGGLYLAGFGYVFYLTTNALVWFLICLFFLAWAEQTCDAHIVVAGTVPTECRASAFAFATQLGVSSERVLHFWRWSFLLVIDDWNPSMLTARCLCWEYFIAVWSGDERGSASAVNLVFSLRLCVPGISALPFCRPI